MRHFYTFIGALTFSCAALTVQAQTQAEASARAAKVTGFFTHAQQVLTTTIAALQAAQYPEDIPPADKLLGTYYSRFGNGYTAYDFALISFPCHEVLRMDGLLYDTRNRDNNSRIVQRFVGGEKDTMIAELQTQLATVRSVQAFCVAAAPHYFTQSSRREDRNHILGAFTGVTQEQGRIVVSIQTPLQTAFVTLDTVKPIAALKGTTYPAAAQEFVNSVCAQGQPFAAKASVLHIEEKAVVFKTSADTATFIFPGRTVHTARPFRTRPVIGDWHLNGAVTCGGKDLGQVLLTAGLVELDHSQSISAESHPEYFAALTDARKNKRGMCGSVPASPAIAPTTPISAPEPSFTSPCPTPNAWEIRASVASHGTNNAKHYTGILCLDSAFSKITMPSPVTQLSGEMHWNCCPGARVDAVVGSWTAQGVVLHRLLDSPHAAQMYVGTMVPRHKDARGAPSFSGTWSAAGTYDGVVRSFSASPLDVTTFSYTNPWFKHE
jgi:hypothetical protein